MSPVKGFDCLKMKDEIQARLRREWEGLSDQEIRDRIHKDLETSQEPVAIWSRRVRAEKLRKQADGIAAR